MPDYRPALAEFRAWPCKWHDYEAVPVTETAGRELLAVVERLLPADLPATHISPTARGGVELVWPSGVVVAVLEVNERGEFSLWAENDVEENTWWGKVGVEHFAAYLREHLPPPAER